MLAETESYGGVAEATEFASDLEGEDPQVELVGDEPDIEMDPLRAAYTYELVGERWLTDVVTREGKVFKGDEFMRGGDDNSIAHNEATRQAVISMAAGTTMVREKPGISLEGRYVMFQTIYAMGDGKFTVSSDEEELGDPDVFLQDDDPLADFLATPATVKPPEVTQQPSILSYFDAPAPSPGPQSEPARPTPDGPKPPYWLRRPNAVVSGKPKTATELLYGGIIQTEKAAASATPKKVSVSPAETHASTEPVIESSNQAEAAKVQQVTPPVSRSQAVVAPVECIAEPAVSEQVAATPEPAATATEQAHRADPDPSGGIEATTPDQDSANTETATEVSEEEYQDTPQLPQISELRISEQAPPERATTASGDQAEVEAPVEAVAQLEEIPAETNEIVTEAQNTAPEYEAVITEQIKQTEVDELFAANEIISSEGSLEQVAEVIDQAVVAEATEIAGDEEVTELTRLTELPETEAVARSSGSEPVTTVVNTVTVTPAESPNQLPPTSIEKPRTVIEAVVPETQMETPADVPELPAAEPAIFLAEPAKPAPARIPQSQTLPVMARLVAMPESSRHQESMPTGLIEELRPAASESAPVAPAHAIKPARPVPAVTRTDDFIEITATADDSAPKRQAHKPAAAHLTVSPQTSTPTKPPRANVVPSPEVAVPVPAPIEITHKSPERPKEKPPVVEENVKLDKVPDSTTTVFATRPEPETIEFVAAPAETWSAPPAPVPEPVRESPPVTSRQTETPRVATEETITLQPATEVQVTPMASIDEGPEPIGESTTPEIEFVPLSPIPETKRAPAVAPVRAIPVASVVTSWREDFGSAPPEPSVVTPATSRAPTPAFESLNIPSPGTSYQATGDATDLTDITVTIETDGTSKRRRSGRRARTAAV